MQWVNGDPRVRALLAAAERGYGRGNVRFMEGRISKAIERIDRGETRLEQEVRRIERPLRFW